MARLEDSEPLEGVRSFPPDERRTSPRSGRRLPGAIAVALAFLIVPGLSAGSILTPPYPHTKVVYASTLDTTGNCPVTANISKVHWSPKTGNLSVAVSASARGCSSLPVRVGSSQGLADESVQVAIPVNVSTGGHKFTVTASYNVTTIAHFLGPSACPYPTLIPGKTTTKQCQLEVEAESSWYIELFDQTNRTVLSGWYNSAFGPRVYLQKDIYDTCTASGVCSNTSSQFSCPPNSGGLFWTNCVTSGSTDSGSNSTWINTSANCQNAFPRCTSWENWTLNGSHKYWILVVIDTSAFAQTLRCPTVDRVYAAQTDPRSNVSGWHIGPVVIS